MSTNRQRDADIDRLLRAALKAESHPQAGPCPDAGLLAAFVEGGVSRQERIALDGHIARCGRCRDTLAVLAREIPAQESATTGVRWFTWVTRPRLRWLVPITAVATAAGFFFATRPLIAPGGVTPDATVTQMAQAPPPPSAQPPSPPIEGAMERDKSAPSPTTQDTQLASRGQAGGRAKDRASGEKPGAEAASAPAQVGLTATERRTAAEAAANPAVHIAADEKRPRAATAPAAPDVAAKTGAAPTLSAAAVREAVQPAPRQEGLRNLQADPMFAEAPGGGVRWRVAPAGQIWRSADAGLTWHSQISGVSADLYAAAAPSAATCWVVGAAGTVLLTENGGRWERRPFPLQVDLTAIEATSARVATVTTRDGRRFETSDGGLSWSPR